MARPPAEADCGPIGSPPATPRPGRNELIMATHDDIDTALEAWRAAERRRARTFVGDTSA